MPANSYIGPPWPAFVNLAEGLPPVERVPLLNRPFGFVCYYFNDVIRGDFCNIQLPIRPKSAVLHTLPTISTADDLHFVHPDTLFAIYLGEAPGVTVETAYERVREVALERNRGLVIAPDSEPMRESVIALATEGDILSPRCFRNEGEATPDYKRRMQREYVLCSAVYGDWECWPTINIHQRYRGETPTLSVRDVVEGFIAACELADEQQWPGMILFRIGTSDCPIRVLEPYLRRFMSGITGVPPARILPDEPRPPPEESEMPVTLPPVVTLRTLDGFINIDPKTGRARLVSTVGAHEKYKPIAGDGNVVFFQHIASQTDEQTEGYYSVDSGGTRQRKPAKGADEGAHVYGGRFALFYNDYQGVPQIADALVIGDEGGAPLPLR